jgi:hypothetical protein
MYYINKISGGCAFFMSNVSDRLSVLSSAARRLLPSRGMALGDVFSAVNWQGGLPSAHSLMFPLTPDQVKERLENAALLATFEELKSELSLYKDNKQSGEVVDRAKARFAEVVSEINRRAVFTRITADDDPSLHEQLLANEKVHPCDRNELLTRRLGPEDTDKACFSLLLNLPDHPLVLAGIYTYFTRTRNDQGRHLHRGLPGFVEHVKHSYPRPIKGRDTAVFYTISSAFPGTGVELVQEVYTHLHPDFVLTTLSPVRDFTKGKNRAEWLSRPASEIQREALSYLLEGKDPVLQFHLANGAYIGDININPESERDWITINYVYPVKPERLVVNRDIYKDHGTIFVSPYLHDVVLKHMRAKMPVVQAFAGGDDIRYTPPGRSPKLP